MHFSKTLKQSVGYPLLVIGLSALLASAGVHAAQCKGLSQSQCGSTSDCTWVNSYTTKSGTKVAAYCRAKPSNGSAKSTSSSAKSSAKKTGDKASKTKDPKKSKDKT